MITLMQGMGRNGLSLNLLQTAKRNAGLVNFLENVFDLTQPRFECLFSDRVLFVALPFASFFSFFSLLFEMVFFRLVFRFNR